MEDVAADFLNELIRRNMIQVVDTFWEEVTECKIHDLLRDLAIQKALEVNFYDIYDLKKPSISPLCRRHAVHGQARSYLSLDFPNLKLSHIKMRTNKKRGTKRVASVNPPSTLLAKRGHVSTRASKSSPHISSPPQPKARTKARGRSEPRKKSRHDKACKEKGKEQQEEEEEEETQKDQEEEQEEEQDELEEGEAEEEGDQLEEEQDQLESLSPAAPINQLSDDIVEFVKDDLPPVPLPTYLTDNAYFENKMITVRSSLPKIAEFKKVLREVNLYEKFEQSCFGHFLQMPAPLFCPKLVHNLLLRRVLCKKKKELWFNFYGLPLRFGLLEFCLMTKLKCHTSPSDEYISQVKERAEDFRKEVTSDGKNKACCANLLDYIKNPELRNMNRKFGACLLYFYTLVLHARDSATGADETALSLAAFPDEFQRHPWGRDVFKLTCEYLSKPFHERKNPANSYNLYGFPFAFVAWAYEAIPGIRSLSKDHGVQTVPRMFRWMTQLSDENAKQVFERLEAPIEVRPVLVPTPVESATVVDGFEPYDDDVDEVIDGLMAQLVGVTMLRKEADIEKPDVESTSEEHVAERVVFVEKIENTGGGFDEVKCTCQCGHCKKFKVDVWQKLVNMEGILKCLKVEKLSKDTDEKMRVEFDSFMLEQKEEGTSLFQGKLYTYQDLDQLMRMEVVMNDKHVEDVMSLMRLRHDEHKHVFLESDLILDLNFSSELYAIFKALVVAAKCVDKPVEEMARVVDVEFKRLAPYAMGHQSYPGGRNWMGVKRVFTVHKLEEDHYVTVVYMIDDATVLVYDSMIDRSSEERAALALASTLLFPRFFQQCVLLGQVSGRALQNQWKYELVQDAPKNNTGTATAGFSLACIDHLVSRTPLDNLCDNSMIRYRDKWARAIFHGKLAL